MAATVTGCDHGNAQTTMRCWGVALAVSGLRVGVGGPADSGVAAGRRLMAFTVRELASRPDTTEDDPQRHPLGWRPPGRP